MSMFASRSTETIPIPFDPGQTVTVRKLTGRELDQAQEAHLRSTIAGRWSAHGWAATFQRQVATGTATAADAERVLRDPLNGYDRHALVKAGVVAWSLAEPALSPEAIDDLGDDELDFFAVEVLKRSKPSLFLTPESSETERKNDSRGSIDRSPAMDRSLSSTT